ncbi:MAG: hypothetical protein ACPGJS_18450 [Flammeovirgaceae bacterium]
MSIDVNETQTILSERMRKLYLTLSLLCVCLVTFAGANPKHSWTLIFEQDGVAFYSATIMNNVAEHAKTLVKIKNTNDYEVRVKFSAEIPCTTGAQNNENVLIGHDGMAMFTYQFCSPDTKSNLTINKVTISK